MRRRISSDQSIPRKIYSAQKEKANQPGIRIIDGAGGNVTTKLIFINVFLILESLLFRFLYSGTRSYVHEEKSQRGDVVEEESMLNYIN